MPHTKLMLTAPLTLCFSTSNKLKKQTKVQHRVEKFPPRPHSRLYHHCHLLLIHCMHFCVRQNLYTGAMLLVQARSVVESDLLVTNVMTAELSIQVTPTMNPNSWRVRFRTPAPAPSLSGSYGLHIRGLLRPPPLK